MKIKLQAVLGVLLYVATSAWSQTATSLTPNIGLQIPAYQSSGWQTSINYDLYQIDLFLSGNLSLPNLTVQGLLTVNGGVSFAGINSNPGTFGDSTHCVSITVNSSGLITSASQSTSCPGGGGGGGTITLTGDVTGSGTGSVPTTLATVNANVGVFGTSSQCASFTVNAKGLITAASQSTNCPGGSGTALTGTLKNEIPSGTINGTNATFTVSQTPSPAAIQLYRNGSLQTLGIDYSFSGTTITFVSASVPQIGDQLFTWYTYGTGGGGSGNATTVNGASVPNNQLIVSNGSGQLVAGNAAVLNTNNRAVLRDNQNALDNGNFSTSGIAASIAACGSSAPCAVLIPPGYPHTEQVPGTSTQNWFDGSPPSAATTASNIVVYQQNYGATQQIAKNCFGYNISGNHNCAINQYDYIVNNSTLRVFDNIGPPLTVTNALDGGVNQGGGGQIATNKLNWSGGGNTLNSWTPGQHEIFNGKMNSYSLGDNLGFAFYTYSWSGPNAESDESNEQGDMQLFGPRDEPTGTIGGYSANVVTVSAWTYGQNHQGAGRYLIRENAGTLTGNIVSISSPGGSPTVVTLASTITASTVVGTIGTNIAPSQGGLSYTATVTPTFTTGSIAGITTSSQVCVADPSGGLEAVVPTAVTGSTFTATFRKPHPASAIMSVGGLSCTSGFSLNYETVTSSNNHLLSGTIIQSLSGSIHNVIPIIYSDSTHVYLFYATNAQWDSWQALHFAGHQDYTIYPISEVISVQSGGTVGNQITLAPNNVAWASGDTFGQPPYFSKAFLTGHWLDEDYWPNSAFNSGGLNYQYNRPMGGNDKMFTLYNNTDPILYQNQVLIPPDGIDLNGYVKWGLNLQYSPDYFLFGVGCASPGLLCAYPETLFRMTNQDSSGNGYDVHVYDPYGSNEYWAWTTRNQTGTAYSMFGDHFDINGGSLTMEEFSGGSQVGITLTGGYVVGVQVPQPLYWGYGVSCSGACNSFVNVIEAQNATLQDYISYDQAAKQFSISTNSNNKFYTFGSTTALTPFFNLYSGTDSATTQSYMASENFTFGNTGVIGASQPPCDTAHLGWLSPVSFGSQASSVLFCTNRNGNIGWTNLGTGVEVLSGAATLAFSGTVPASDVYQLTGNVSSWTLTAGPIGQIKTITWCQDTTGGRTVSAAPSNVKGFVTPGTTANTCSSQQFIQLLTPNEWQAINGGIQNVPI